MKVVLQCHRLSMWHKSSVLYTKGVKGHEAALTENQWLNRNANMTNFVRDVKQFFWCHNLELCQQF